MLVNGQTSLVIHHFSCIFQNFLTFEEIFAKNEIFFAQTCLGTFSLKKVRWPNHLSRCYHILHEKTIDHTHSDSSNQNILKQIS